MGDAKFGRRTLVFGGVAAAAGLAVPTWRWLAGPPSARPDSPFGALRPDPDGIFDLLEGFSYRILERSGARMDDGHRVPGRPDAMAIFEGDEPGSLVLMRNHELPLGVRARLLGTETGPAQAYDRRAAGGVSRVVIDARTFERRSSNLVLTGTVMNCAGGPSPWGWLSCEETELEGHGYVFLTDPSADGLREPERVTAYGRFAHEAAAVVPERHTCYLSEDHGDGAFYRFVPHDPASPFRGQLQALAVRGRPAADLATLGTGERREITWVDIEEEADRPLRAVARAAGAARVKRGEGLWWHDGEVYLASTSGGPVDGGQLFRLRDEDEGGQLESLFTVEDRRVLDMPDNLTVSPSGQLFVVEDGPEPNHIRGLTADGRIFDFGRNALSSSELCGVCFSPAGDAMFVNIQEDGLTLVITGPFESLLG